MGNLDAFDVKVNRWVFAPETRAACVEWPQRCGVWCSLFFIRRVLVCGRIYQVFRSVT